MELLAQFAAPFRALAAPRRLAARGWGLLIAYLIAAGVILGLFASLLIANQEHLRQAIVGYLLPGGWHFAADLLIERLLASQAKEVLVNAAASGSLVLVSVLLFPLKEKLSAAFERDSALTGKHPAEFPLWFQALEELKLVLLYATAWMVIFWIGYHPDPSRKLLSMVLSYAFLFFTFAVDFIAPLLQRHRLRYSQAIKTLFAHPFAAFGFGALFALPSVAVGLLVKHSPELSLSGAVLLLFGVNVIAIAWAAVGGTWLGAQLLADAERTRRSSALVRALAWLALLGTFAVNSYLLISLGQAIHHKSQILKCEYSVDFGSIHLQLPRTEEGGWKGALKGVWNAVTKGKVEVGAGMTVTIKNPTAFDVELEKNRIRIAHGETEVATTAISPLRVPAGQTVESQVDFTVELNPRAVLKGTELLRNRWTITLYLQVTDAFEFPVYLLTPNPGRDPRSNKTP